MKKILLFSCAMAILVLPSCNPGESETKTTGTLPAYNLVTNLDNGDTFTTKNSYKFEMNWTKASGTVTTDNLVINNNTWSMVTEPSTIYSYLYATMLKPTQGTFYGNSTLPLKNATFMTTPYYYFNYTYVPGYSNEPETSEIVVANYMIGDEYKVRTFIPDATFRGTTNTTYPGQGGVVETNTTDSISYRVIMNIDKKKSDLIMYKAKFSNSEREPEKAAIIIKDLDLAFDSNGYTITGEDIIPETIEGNSTTPVPAFIINNITLATINENLTKCNISFVVAGIYTGDFTGSYILEIEDPK